MKKSFKLGAILAGALVVGVGLSGCVDGNGPTGDSSASSEVVANDSVSISEDAPSYFVVGSTIDFTDFITGEGSSPLVITSNNENITMNEDGTSARVNSVGPISVRIQKGDVLRNFTARAVTQDFDDVATVLLPIAGNYYAYAEFGSGQDAILGGEVYHHENYYYGFTRAMYVDETRAYVAYVYEGVITYEDGQSYSLEWYDIYAASSGAYQGSTYEVLPEMTNFNLYTYASPISITLDNLTQSADGTISLDEDALENILLNGVAIARTLDDLTDATDTDDNLIFGTYAGNAVSVNSRGVVTVDIYDNAGRNLTVELQAINSFTNSVLDGVIEDNEKPTPLDNEKFDTTIGNINTNQSSFEIHANVAAAGSVRVPTTTSNDITIPESLRGTYSGYPASNATIASMMSWSGGYFASMVDFGTSTAIVEGDTYYAYDHNGNIEAFTTGDDGYVWNVISEAPAEGAERTYTGNSFSREQTDIWELGTIPVSFGDTSGASYPSYITVTPAALNETTLGNINWGSIEEENGVSISYATPYNDEGMLLTWLLSAVPVQGSYLYLAFSGLYGDTLTWYDFWDSIEVIQDEETITFHTNLGWDSEELQLLDVLKYYYTEEELATAFGGEIPSDLGTVYLSAGFDVTLTIANIGNATIPADVAAAINTAVNGSSTGGFDSGVSA